MHFDLTDRVFFITGATDGLGHRVALDLAAQGAIVLSHGRSDERGRLLLNELQEAGAHERSKFYQADLASLEAVRALADQVEEEQSKITCLINNAGAGVGAPGEKRAESVDGFELRFAVNYLAPFLLTHLLVPVLRKSAPARIVNVSSVGQQAIDFDDVMLKAGYSGGRAYSQSKLALIMFTIDLARSLKAVV